MNPSVSILVAHYAGHERNLFRSLLTLRAQTYPSEIVVMDDGSEQDLALDGYFRLRPFGAPPRPNLLVFQEAYKRCKGNFIILTDADILVPCEAAQVMVDNSQHSGRIVPILYGLETDRTDLLECSLDELQATPGFWGWHNPQGAYNADAPTVKHHTLFCGQRRDLWEANGIFTTSRVELTPEEYLFQFDHNPILQIPIHVYHQWHSRVDRSARIRRIQCAS